MKIEIITIHSIANFGSVFQAYALQQHLNSLQHKVRLIDYEPLYFKRRGVIAAIGRLINFKAYNEKTKKFSRFIENNMILTEKCRSFEDLEHLQKDADVYISGGDQLWNPFYPCGNDPAYKLQFVKNKKKIAYGTSIAQRQIPDTYAALLKQQIADYSFVGVRESSSVSLLKTLGKDAQHVVDPVLLLSREHYDRILRVPNEKGYLFVYLVYEPSKLLDEAIAFISKSLNLKVIACTGFRRKCKADYYVKNEGPDEVLGFIKNADFVISASFHCTLFALLYNKQFISMLPTASTNERLKDLLHWTGLESRIVKDMADVNREVLNSIDYGKTNDKMDGFIRHSKFLLSAALAED